MLRIRFQRVGRLYPSAPAWSAWLGVMLLSAGSPRAQEPVEFAVEYSAPAECPTVNDFVRAVTLRVPAARAAPSLAAKTRFRVALAPSEGGVSGTLTVFVAGADPSERQVPGAACDDAVASMAVMAALVLEGRAGAAAVAGAAATPEGAPPAPPAGPNPASEARAPPPPAEPARPAELPLSEKGGLSRILDLRAVAGGAVEGAVRSVASFGVWGGADLVFRQPWPSAVRLSVLYVPPVVESNPRGNAEFRLLAGALSLCPVRLGIEPLTVSPCATLELGELHGKGLLAVNAGEQSMFWLSGVVSVRPEARLASIVWLTADAGLRVLAHHDRFVFDPDVTVHDVPQFSYGFAFGVSVRPY